MRCHALNWHLLSLRSATVPLSKKLVFFIGWLVTLLRLVMSKRPWSASSRFNLTEWRVGVYLITVAQALLSAVTVLRCLDSQAPLVFDSSAGRALIKMQHKCCLLFGSRWSSLTLLLFSFYAFLSMQCLLPSVSYFLFFSCSAPLSHLVFFLSLLYICLLPAFHLWTSPWTWLALSELSYGLLFHEQRHYNFSSLLLRLSLPLALSCT